MLVYVGAVMVLFLFVVMMLDINVDSMREGFWKHFPLAASIGALIALEMAAVLMGGFRPAEEPRALPARPPRSRRAVSNTKELGKLLYTEYLYPLEIAAVILLVAIIAAVALTLRQRKDSKHIDPAVAGAGQAQRPPAHRQDAAVAAPTRRSREPRSRAAAQRRAKA